MSEREYLAGTSVWGGKLEERDLEAERHAWDVKQAKKLGWQQVDFDRLRARDDRYVVDVKTGNLYTEILHKPLMSERPQDEPVAVFAAAAKCDFRYFRLPADGVRTLADLDARQRAQELAEADDVEHERERLRNGPQTPLTLADLAGEPLPTLRGAAETILDAGGRIEADRHGRLRITAPDQVVPLVWGAPMGERERRQQLAQCAHVLASAADVVLDALRHGDRKPLPERLADRQVTLTGTLA